MRKMRKTKIAALLAMLLPGPARAGDVAVAPESVFAVVTMKGGAAAGLAHNHFMAATKPEVKLTFDPASPATSTFDITLAVADLKVDPFDLEKAHYPRLEKLGILKEPFAEVPEKDRGKIRDSMIDEGQLNAAKFPKIKARIASVAEKPMKQGDTTYPYTVTLALEVVGKRVEKPVGARYEVKGETLEVEAIGAFKFTDFGIKPYSAFLGAVKVLDDFYVYVNLKGALPAAPPPAEAPAATPAATPPAP